MTITGSGNPLSLNALNVEFGRGGTSQLSLSQSFAGTYAQYGAINRNAGPGQNVYNVFTGGVDFAISWFYDYNDTENNYWSYIFDNTNFSLDMIVNINLASNSIYNNTISGTDIDSSSGYVDTTYSATTGNDLDLQLEFPSGTPSSVDITVTDPDTLATIFSDLGANPNNYKGMTNLATVYGYQRFDFAITSIP
jgi:hypothetical protein